MVLSNSVIRLSTSRSLGQLGLLPCLLEEGDRPQARLSSSLQNGGSGFSMTSPYSSSEKTTTFLFLSAGSFISPNFR